jgi:hypothetical protein
LTAVQLALYPSFSTRDWEFWYSTPREGKHTHQEK